MKKLLVCALLAACGPKSTTTTKEPENQGGDGIGAVLVKDVGAGVPVAIVPGPNGLRAISADGARERTLAEGYVPWALVDARADVIWFGSTDSTSILMIDLRGTGDVETIVTGLPTETDFGGAPLVSIVHPKGELTAGGDLVPRAVLVVAATPELSSYGGILEMWEQHEDYDARVKQATIVGAARVAELAARPDDSPAQRGYGDPQARVDVDVTACPDDPDTCGESQAIAGTKYWRVVTEYSCGDGCYTTHTLYDPTTQAFLEDEWRSWLADSWVAPDGSAFVTSGMVVRFDGGVVATTRYGDVEIGVGGGWLGGGTYYGN